LINVIDTTKLLSKYKPGGVQNGLCGGLIWTLIVFIFVKK